MLTPDSESVLDRLDRLEREATAGPWEDYDRAMFVTDREWMKPHVRRSAVADCGYSESPHRDNDAALIALSRNHLRALLDVARAASAQGLFDILDDSTAYLLQRQLANALASLLTTPSEQKEET